MIEVVYTDAAERDLTQISSYIAADNPRAAIRFVDRLRQKCEHLSRFRIGRMRPEVHSGVRSMPHGSYIIFFEWDDMVDEVRILRIWHGSRKAPTITDLY